MRWHRLSLGIGFAILVAVTAASIGLDIKSRDEVAWVDHTLKVLNQLSDVRLLFRRTESAARGYLLNSNKDFLTDYKDSLDRIAPMLAELKEMIHDNPAQMQVLTDIEPTMAARLAAFQESIRVHEAGDRTAMTAVLSQSHGPKLMEDLTARLDQLTGEEKQLLASRNLESLRTGRNLLSIDLFGAALILILGMISMRGFHRSNLRLQTNLQATEATVAERTSLLQATHVKLEHSSSVLASTFAGMAEAVLVLNDKREIILSNAAAERLLNCYPGEAIEESMTRNVAYHADGTTQLGLCDTPSARALRGEQFDDQEIIVRRSDRSGLLQFSVSGRPLFGASGSITGAALIYHDTTASRETERKLHQSQKLDAIGKLTGGVAHDFNNMLTVITGTTEMLVAGLKTQPDLLGAAMLIDQATQRCTELIQHLLAFARKQPLQPRNVNINEAIVDIAKLLRSTLGENIQIDSVLRQEVANAHIDPSQLANSIVNMAINARDAMPNGGKLLLETANVVLDEAYAHDNPDVQPGRYIMLAVSDSGTGMPAEVRDKVFEPFFTTKDVGKGTGLGLSMVFGFVKQSGGHIKIYSEVGHGTTIRLYLPTTAGNADIIVPVASPTTGGTETILIVEDDALVRNFVTAQLHSLGYRTAAVGDSQAALAYVDDRRPFDLLFTDVIMPGAMTGRQLADEVKRRRPGTKVLYTSGYTDNGIVHHGRLDEGVLLLSKPYRKSALAQMVRDALELALV
jgi:signal transduction histidine kinase/CHASE3 domain sensor protein